MKHLWAVVLTFEGFFWANAKLALIISNLNNTKSKELRVRRVQTCIAQRGKDLNARHLQHWSIWDACNTAFILRKCLCVVWGPFGVRRGVLGGEAGLALIIDCLLNYLSPVWANWGWIKETSVSPYQVEGRKCVSVTLYVLNQKMINTTWICLKATFRRCMTSVPREPVYIVT